MDDNEAAMWEMWREEVMGPDHGILTNSQRNNAVNLSMLEERIRQESK